MSGIQTTIDDGRSCSMLLHGRRLVSFRPARLKRAGLAAAALLCLLPATGLWTAAARAGGASPAVAGKAAPAGTAPTAGAFSESTEVTVVQVPVQVVRGGEPVRGLTAADFEVFDGGKRPKLSGFEVLDLAARQGPALRCAPP